MPEALHLLAPGWLLLLLPVAGLLWLLWRRPGERGAWSQVVDARLQPLLLGSRQGRRPSLLVGLLALAWLVAVLALANPAWERQAESSLAGGASRVVVLELSRSMLADDIRPSRLVRARLKVEDLIDSESAAGETGLVAYAGDAFTVTPLTRDADTLRALLRVLEPGIMPAQGSRLDLALGLADQLLRQSGVENGEVIVIADGADEAALREAKALARDGHRVSVLGVGIPGPAGSLSPTAFDAAALQAIADAGGGRYAALAAGTSDIQTLLRGAAHGSVDPTDDDLKAQAWQGRGPLLALFLVPLAALAFRRGWLMVWMLGAIVYLPVPPVHASAWDDLWLRPDQQAAQALADADYERAAATATDPLVRGAAAYRRGDYQAALSAYRQSGGAEGAYNEGNALAMSGQYVAAVDAYGRALALEPTMDDAEFNKRLIEGLLAQRDQDREDTDRPPTQETSEPESSQAEADQQSADAEESSGSEQASPSNEGTDGGEVASESETDKADEESGEQTGGETAQAPPSESEAGDESDEASSAGDEQVAGDQPSNEPAEGNGQDTAQDQGAVADAAADQGGVESGTQMAQVGEQDDTGEGLSADDAAAQAGQEDDTADRTEGTEQPSPDSSGEAGRVASAEIEPSDAAGDDSTSEESETPDQKQPGQAQTDDPQAAEVGRSFAEANQLLAERQEDGADGEGSLPEPDASNQAAGQDVAAPPGPGAGDDPRARPGSVPAASEWSTEERLAAEQWLRRIPDDPGGLLRRKFLYQYRERQRAIGGNQPPPR